MIEFLGVRGSLPVSGADTVRYGGNTPCLHIPIDKSTCVIIDAGSGIREVNRIRDYKEFHIFFTHLHWDHVIGLPFLSAMFNSSKTVHIYYEHKESLHPKDFLRTLFAPPFFPVPREYLSKNIHLHEIHEEKPYQFGGVELTFVRGAHPNDSYLVRINDRGTVTVFATDYEHGTQKDCELVQLCLGATNLIYDTAYLPDDYDGKRDGVRKAGWGHSTYEYGVAIAKSAGVKNLYLYHYSPDYDDHTCDQMLAASRKIFPNTIGATDRMVIP